MGIRGVGGEVSHISHVYIELWKTRMLSVCLHSIVFLWFLFFALSSALCYLLPRKLNAYITYTLFLRNNRRHQQDDFLSDCLVFFNNTAHSCIRILSPCLACGSSAVVASFLDYLDQIFQACVRNNTLKLELTMYAVETHSVKNI